MAEESAEPSQPPISAATGGRSRMAAWNFATLGLFTLVTTFTGLAISPSILGSLGKERSGSLRMILEASGYLALLELGLGGTLSPLLARAIGRLDPDGLRRTMAVGTRLYLAIAGGIVVIGLCLLPWLDWVIPAPIPYRGEVRSAWLITVLGFSLLVLSPFRALADAYHRGYRVNILLTAQAVFLAVASLAFARAGWGIGGQALAMLLANALVSLTLAADGLRHHPEMIAVAFTGRGDRQVWRSLWALSPATMLMNVCGRLSILTDYLIVGNILIDGPAWVTSLFFTQRLAVMAQAQLQGIGGAAWPGLAELYNQGNLENFRRRVVELSRLITILGVAVLAPIVAYNAPFFALWMRGRPTEYAGQAVIILAAANALIVGLNSFWGYCFGGTGQIRRMVVANLAATVLNVAISVGGTALIQAYHGPKAALIGPLLGTALGNLLVNSWALPLLLKRTFGVDLRALAGSVLRPLAIGLPYGLACWMAARTYPPTGWLTLILETGVSSAGFLALAWLYLISPEDRQLWKRRVAGMIPGRRPPRPTA